MLLASVVGFVSCSPEKQYEVLSFFFDGVPRPGESTPEPEVSPQYMEDLGPRTPVKLDLVLHEPYRKHECETCHPKEQSLAIAEGDPRGICYRCHQHEAFRDKVSSFEFIHGPVAVASCLPCHDPHESRYPKLLNTTAPELCYYCHDQDFILSSPRHKKVEHWDCLKCHDPHGGSNRFFVKLTGKEDAVEGKANDRDVSQKGAEDRGRP